VCFRDRVRAVAIPSSRNREKTVGTSGV